MRTNQQIFDNVVTNLRRQGCKSGEQGHYSYECLYRGPNGTKCAAGWEIPDELYDPKIEGAGVSGGIGIWEQLGYTQDNIDLLRDLQECHDDYEVKAWELRWEEIAEEWGLEYTAPTEETVA